MKALLPLALVACATPYPQYDWDGKRVVCSAPIDDYKDGHWSRVEDSLQDAADHHTVALLHAHVPGQTIAIPTIARLLDLADQHGLDYVTFAELDRSEPRAGLALAFDDSSIDAWFGIREVLAAHGARVTFFVTRVYQYTDALLATLAALAAEGHDIEAHSVDHLDAEDFIADHTVADYVATEVVPSIQILEAQGYPVTSYAFPFGDANDALTGAVLEHVERVRVGPGSCPD